MKLIKHLRRLEFFKGDNIALFLFMGLMNLTKK